MLQTEHEFSLPMGLIDEDGNLHREGVMRLATAADEIMPLKDPRVKKNPAYLSVILLSRVVTSLGGLETITPKTIENLFARDLSYLVRTIAREKWPDRSRKAEVVRELRRSAKLLDAG